MSLFRRRCPHIWEVKAARTHTRNEKYVWEMDWHEVGDETVIYYVCSTCHDDTTRTVEGSFTVASTKELFPKP